ncbi:hypothetical protein [Segatella copri]|uniref:hypothetical protein n=1 Tax=Segatella copri TaxID=165179 RepID=UPI0021A6CB9E|nr:hypothetical protein [Segatella copri]UWP52463.1 hypothetical protein NQ544_00665 [Segatella copri DSM 18205]
MNLQETIIQLNELKLRGMSSSFEAMTSLPVQNRPSLKSPSPRWWMQRCRTDEIERPPCI